MQVKYQPNYIGPADFVGQPVLQRGNTENLQMYANANVCKCMQMYEEQCLLGNEVLCSSINIIIEDDRQQVKEGITATFESMFCSVVFSI